MSTSDLPHQPERIQLLLTVAQAADRLNLSRSKTYELTTSGRLPSVKIDGSRRIVPEQLDAFVASLPREGYTPSQRQGDK